MKFRLLHILLLFHPFAVTGQPVYFSNPSFEGLPGKNQIPDGWFICNDQSTPDLQPVEVNLAPTDGQSYVGLVMRGTDDPEPKNEDIRTTLLRPLSSDTTYILSVDLAYTTDLTDSDSSILYNEIPRLRISGSASPCAISQVFVVSNPITNKEWMRYCFLIRPSSEISCLSFEIFEEPLKAAYLLMDNVTIEPFKITGASHICRGAQNQIYTFPFNCAMQVTAEYTGTGATIGNIAGNQISIGFSADATSGHLILDFGSTDSKLPGYRFPITIDDSLPGTGTIAGPSSVCQGITEFFSSNVTNTTRYNWRYTGTGVTLNPKGTGVDIDFSRNATSGKVILEPENGCGTGTPLSYAVAVIPLPVNAGLITGGYNQVCQGETITYHTDLISFATDYYWSYTGEGVTLSNGRPEMEISFGENSTGGYLTVKGTNLCGEGEPSLEYIVFVNELPEKAPAIEGVSEICPDNSGNSYYVPLIRGAEDYLWNFTGQGVQISGNANQIQFDILSNVTDGVLTVSGRNACGTGEASPPFSISFNETCNLFIPNAFSPNDDGINDRFIIRNLNPSSRFIVFDRSGKIVFETDNYDNDWDGKDKSGRMLPSDTYWYVFIPGRLDKEIKGYVYLKR